MPEGIVDSDGVLYELDVLICATGVRHCGIFLGMIANHIENSSTSLTFHTSRSLTETESTCKMHGIILQSKPQIYFLPCFSALLK